MSFICCRLCCRTLQIDALWPAGWMAGWSMCTSIYFQTCAWTPDNVLWKTSIYLYRLFIGSDGFVCTYGFWLICMNFHSFLWILIDFHIFPHDVLKISWFSMDSDGFTCIFHWFSKCLLILYIFSWFSWLLHDFYMDSDGFSYILFWCVCICNIFNGFWQIVMHVLLNLMKFHSLSMNFDLCASHLTLFNVCIFVDTLVLNVCRKNGFVKSCFQQSVKCKMTSQTKRKHHAFSKNSTV